jgi:O-antigen ligase
VWLAVSGVIGVGVALGMMLAGSSPSVVLGTLAVLVAVGAAVYRPAFGLAVLAFTYPYDLTTSAGPVKLTTSAALMGILVAVWVVRQVLPNPPAVQRTPLDIPVILFAGATYLSLLGFGGNLDQQLVGLLKATGGFLIFFIATQSIGDRRDIWLVLGAIVATGLIQAVSLTYAVFTGAQQISTDTRWTGIVIDPNLYAGYLVLVIPLVMAVGLSIRSRWSLVASAMALIAFTVALIATLSRSGWIGVVVATIVLAVLLPKRRWALAAVGASIALALVIGGMLGPIGARLSSTEDGPIAMLVSRWDVWTSAVAIARDHPAFGVGVANFINYYPEYSGQSFGIDHAHNILLNMLAERGLIGLAAFAVVLVVMFRSLFLALGQAASGSERTLVAGLIAVFAGYLAHSMFDVSYYDYKILLLFWLLAGTAAVVGQRQAQATEPSIARNQVPSRA